MSENKIIIFGTGEFAQEIFLYLKKFSKFEVVAFTAHKEFIKDKMLFEKPIIPFEEIENHYSVHEASMLICVGFSKMNKKREKIFYEIKKKKYKLENFIHPSNYIWDEFEIGENCIINSKSLIEHGVKIENNCHIATGGIINGDCYIKKETFIGSNSTVIQGKIVGPNSIIGSGKTLKKNLPSNSTYK